MADKVVEEDKEATALRKLEAAAMFQTAAVGTAASEPGIAAA